jgi:hypothetical protein
MHNPPTVDAVQKVSTPGQAPVHWLVHMPPGYCEPVWQMAFAVVQSADDEHPSPICDVPLAPEPSGVL